MAEDITSGPLQVRGLRQATENFNKLPGIIKDKVAQDALRAAGYVIANAVRANTYTTFKRIDGAIAAGLHVSVGRDLKGNVLNAVVGEYPTTVAARVLKPNARNPKPAIAFWWRFLEFGTHEHHAVAAPRFMRKHKVAKTTRQRLQAMKWQGSPMKPGITARPWVRPTLAATAQESVDTFVRVFDERTQAEVNQLPK